MNNNILKSPQGEILNDTPLGTEPINSMTGLEEGPKFKIDVDKFKNAGALSRQELIGRIHTDDVEIPKAVYRILDDMYHPEFDPEYNAILLSREQTNAGKFVAALNQAVVGEMFAGTLEGLSYLVDLPMMVDLAEGTEQEFGNALTDFAKGIKGWTREATPVFTDPTAPKFNPTSWEWWMSNAPSIASSISLALPAVGGMKALSAVGKLVGMTGKAGKYSKLFSTATGQAIMSRHMESLMEASGDHQQNIEIAKQKLYQKYANQIDSEIKLLPVFTPVDPELGPKPGQYTQEQYQKDLNRIKNKWESVVSEEASKIAAVSASNTYAKNWVMLLQDIPEYMLLGRLIKPGVKGIAKEAVENSAEVAKRVGMDMPKFYASKVAKQIGNMAGEGLVEENYQFLVNKQSANMIANLDNPEKKNSLVSVLGDEYDNGELWTNIFFGALGAGAMQATMAGLNAKAFSEAAKTKIKNINTWSTLMYKLKSDYVAAEELGDEALKEAAIQNFVAATGLKSIELGNKEHLLNMIDALASGDENVLLNYEMESGTRSFMKGHNEIATDLKKSIESIDKKYKDAMLEVVGKGVEENKARPIARSIAHANHMLEFLNGKQKQAQENLKGLQVLGYNTPTPENEQLSIEGQQIFAARHEKDVLNKRISQLDKRAANNRATEAEKNSLGKIKQGLQKRVKEISDEAKELGKSPNVSEDQRVVDKKLLGTEKKSGVISQSDVSNYLNAQEALESYNVGIEEFKDQLEQARLTADELGKKKPDSKPTTPSKPTTEDDGKVFKGSVVSYKDPETGEDRLGVVDEVEYATKDSKGQDIVPKLESADNFYTVTSLDERDKGKQVHLSGLSIKPVSPETVKEIDNGLAEDDTDDWDAYVKSTVFGAISIKDAHRRKTNTHKSPSQESEKGLMEFVSWAHYEDVTDEEAKELVNNGQTPKLIIRNEGFNKFISNPENQKYLDNATAEFSIDVENKDFKAKLKEWKSEKGLHKNLPKGYVELIEEFLKGKKQLSAENLKVLSSIPSFYGELPISVRLTINGKPFTEGLYLHTLSKTLGSLTNKDVYKAYKDMRLAIVKHLIKGDKIYTKGLSTNRGNPLNIDKSNSVDSRKRNVAETLKTPVNELELYVLKSSTKLSKQIRSAKTPDEKVTDEYENPRLVKSAEETVVMDFNSSSTGSVFAKTSLTVNGKPFAVKLNKSFVSRDHAFLLFHAFSNLAKSEVRGLGKIVPRTDEKSGKDDIGYYNTPLGSTKEDKEGENVIDNISAGELLDLLVVHGEELTNPDSERYSGVNEYKRMSERHRFALKNKRLFLKRGYDDKGNINAVYLCYGVSVEPHPINTSTPGTTKLVDYNVIDLTSPVGNSKDGIAYQSSVESFVDWVSGKYDLKTKKLISAPNKTYAVHLEHKRIGQKLNGSFLQGRSFRLGKKGLKVQVKDVMYKGFDYTSTSEILRKPGESYVEFLVNNGFVTTDLEAKDGLLFDTPFVKLGLDRTASNFGIIVGEPDKAETKVASTEVTEETDKNVTVTEEVKVDKPKATKKVKGKKSVSDVMNKGQVHLRERKISVRKPYDKQDLEKELSWVRKKLNIKDVEVEKRLSNMMLHGKRAWAIYSSEAIKLYELAESGTIYHEGFHRVSLGYFTKQEREAIYRSARQLYRMSKEEFTDNQVEEKLAEEFRDFVLMKGKESQPSIIKRIFQEIVDFIKAVFYRVAGKGLTHSDIERLFNQIYSGRYRFSNIRSENLGVEPRLRELMGLQFDTISSYKDITDITKYLSCRLFAANKISDLSKVRKIKWQPLINDLNNTISELQSIIEDEETSEAERNVALKSQSLLKDVLGEKGENGEYSKFNSFKYYISKFLRSNGIIHRERDTDNDEFFDSDDFFASLDSEEKSVRLGSFGDVDYFKPLKENALANVKFVINTLHESDDINESTGLVGFVNGNKVWAKLLNDIIKYDDVYEMIDEIKAVGEREEYYPYIELASYLEKSSESFRTQFQTTFEAHRHEFINASFHRIKSGEGSNAGINITFDDAAHSELKRGTALRWAEYILYDNKIIEGVKEEDTSVRDKKVNKDFFTELASDYRDVVEGYYREVSNNGRNELSDTELEELYTRVARALSKMHIDVSTSVLRRYTHNINPDNQLQDNLEVAISNILDMLSPETITEDDKPTTPMGNIHFLSLATAYAEVNTHEEAGMVLGPQGGSFYRYAKLNHATDIVRKIKRGPKWAQDKLSRRYNGHSRIMNSFVPGETVNEEQAKLNRSKFKLVTLAAFKSGARADRGREYLKINTIEDYLLKANSVLKGGLLPFPIIANRQTYYFMQGVKLVGIKDAEGDILHVIKSSDKDGNVQFTDEVLDLFYGYYLDEKDRIDKAVIERNEYEAENKRLQDLKKQPGVDIKSIDKQIRALKHKLIANYHYRGNYNLKQGNAYYFIHFKGFEGLQTPEEVRTKINNLLNDRLKDDIRFLYDQQIIGSNTEKERKESGELLLYNKLFDQSMVDNHRMLEEQPHNFAMLSVISKVMVNTMMGIVESEKMFLGDPALFKRNKRGQDRAMEGKLTDSEFDVYEDVYKRWFGVGSTGTRLRAKYNGRGNTYNVSVFNTQSFESKYYPEFVEKHTGLYEKLLKNRLSKEELADGSKLKDIQELAKTLAESRLSKFRKVDATDGMALISPYMYKQILDRMGIWGKDARLERAYNLLQSDKELTPEEIIEASNIVFNPLKTMYMGNHNFNGVDLLIYNKMAMFTLFRQHVKGTHLEKVLDRMESKKEFKNLEKVDVYNFNSAVKVGALAGVDLFENENTRNKTTDFSESLVFQQSFDNLKHQQVTDPHDSARQNFGTAGIKIGMADIDMNSPYGSFKTGRELLEAMSESRVAASDFGVHKVNAKFGIVNGKVSQKVFTNTLRQDAESANKSQDVVESFKVGADGKKYLELDSYPNRRWIYSRIKSLVDDETVTLSTPGNQLYQMSDYGMGTHNYKSDLQMTRSKAGSSTVYAMECRVSARLFKAFFPAGHVITQEDLQKLLDDETLIFGYRVPTQGQNSIVKLKIVEFLPEQTGDIIQLPLEFTALTGSDFDIDKLFVAMFNYEHEYDGDAFKGLKKVAFKTDENSTAEERYKDKVIELFSVYRHNPDMFAGGLLSKYFKDYDNKFRLSDIESKIDSVNEEYGEELDLLMTRRESMLDKLSKSKNKEYNKALEDDIATANRRIEEIQEIVYNMPLQRKVDKQLEDVDYEMLKGILIKSGVLQKLEDFKKLPISFQNTNAACCNRLLDCLFTVLSDEKHFLNMTTPLGSCTDLLENKSAYYEEVYSRQSIRNVPALFTTTPSFQAHTKEKFAASVFGIAPYALNNNNHSLTQMADVSLKYDIDLGFNKKGEVSLARVMGEDNRAVTSWISALIDINVDGVNKPTAAPLNINESTHDVVNFLVRAGIGEPVFDFIAQPAIRSYSSNFFKSATGSKRFSTITSIDSKDPLGDTREEYATNAVDGGFFKKEELEYDIFLENSLIPLSELLNERSIPIMREDAKAFNKRSLRTKGWYQRQLSILWHLGALKEASAKLNAFVLACRVDTKKYGSKPTEILHFIKSIQNIIDSEDFTNVEKILTANPNYEYKAGDTFLPTLIRNSMFKIYEILKYESLYSSYGFRKLLEELVTVTPQGEYNRMGLLNMLSEELVTFFMGKFFADPVNGFGMDHSKLTKLLFEKRGNKFFEMLIQLKNGTHPLSKELEGNAFMDSIVVDFSDNILKFKDNRGSVYTYIKTLYRSLRDDLEKDELVDSFKQIVYSDKKELRDLGIYLYMYSFYTSAFRDKRFSYASWMPLSLNKELEYDGRVISLNNFVSGLLKELNAPDGYIKYIQDAKRDVFLNTADTFATVPSVVDTIVAERFVTKDDEPLMIRLRYEDMPKSFWLGRNADKNHVFIPYVIDSSNDLYEYVGYDRHSLDPYYVNVPFKGFGNKGIMAHEYGIKTKKGDIRSVFATNHAQKLLLTVDQMINKVLTDPKLMSESQRNLFNGVSFENQIVKDKSNQPSSSIWNNDAAMTAREEESELNAQAEVDAEKAVKQRSLATGYDDEVEALDSNIKQSVDNKTTRDHPIYIDVDGSAKGENGMGIGGYSKFGDKEYYLYRNDEKIRSSIAKLAENAGVEVPDNISNPTAELYSVVTVLYAFRNTSEHLHIRNDNEMSMLLLKNNLVNLKNKPQYNAKEPIIKILTDMAKEYITSIENNGGTVKFEWVESKSTPQNKIADVIAKGKHKLISKVQNDFSTEQWGKPTKFDMNKLSPPSPFNVIEKIISGGQTGADEAGLEIADEMGLKFGGTAAYGYNQQPEKGKNIPNYKLRDYYRLKQGKKTIRIVKDTNKYWDDFYSDRTAENVKNSSGTVWFGHITEDEKRGYGLTERATKANDKPFLVNPTEKELADWIVKNDIRILNVAGNREYLNVGVKNRTKKTIREALELLRKPAGGVEVVNDLNASDVKDGSETTKKCRG